MTSWSPPTADVTKSTTYSVPDKNWTEIAVEIPSPPDMSGIVRLSFPSAEDRRVEIESPESKTRRWNFTPPPDNV